MQIPGFVDAGALKPPPRNPHTRCSGLCLTGWDVGVPYSGIAYPHPECDLHGMWELDLVPESQVWFNECMTHLTDYSADDIEDLFDLYRRDDGVTTLDRGLARLFDEEPIPATCSICDGVGHGYPGAGPCPLEERGEQGVPWWAQ